MPNSPPITNRDYDPDDYIPTSPCHRCGLPLNKQIHRNVWVFGCPGCGWSNYPNLAAELWKDGTPRVAGPSDNRGKLGVGSVEKR